MLYLFGAKKMQTSAKKACFQFAECSFSYAKIRLFLITSKVLGKKYLKRGRRTKKNRRLPELRAAYWLYYFYYDETDAYSTVQ